MLAICRLPIIFCGEDENLAAEYQQLFKEFFVSSIPANKGPALEVAIESGEDMDVSGYDYELAPFRFLKSGDEIKVWNRYCRDGYVLLKAPWNRAVIHETASVSDITRLNLFQMAFSSFLSNNQGIFMHGAVIAYQNSGIIFTASPGGGKSTQADLWQHRLGAEIINGDKAMLCLNERGTMVYGSPWSGSSDYKLNKGVLLKAVIVLEKGDSNKIRLMKGAERLSELGVHIYFPYWCKALIDSTMLGLDELFKCVPVYQLICKPDEEAVHLVKETVFM